MLTYEEGHRNACYAMRKVLKRRRECAVRLAESLDYGNIYRTRWERTIEECDKLLSEVASINVYGVDD